MCKLYKTWKHAKGVFVKPSLHVYFGRWIKDPNLPCWRNGPIIFLCGKHKLSDYAYRVCNSVLYCEGLTKDGIKSYRWSTCHKLPGKLKREQFVWRKPIREKLKKWHLGWIPPVIYLPIWLRFHIVNLDVVWKTKFDEIRYEYPPQFSIIAFGLSLTFTLHYPTPHDRFANDDHYWESLLNYVYGDNPTVANAVRKTGVWCTLNDDDSKTYYAALRPEFLEHIWLFEYYHTLRSMATKYKEGIL